jgi:hypothetical protein
MRADTSHNLDRQTDVANTQAHLHENTLAHAGTRAATFLNNEKLVTGLKITMAVLKLGSLVAKVASGHMVSCPSWLPFDEEELMNMVDQLEDLEDKGDQVNSYFHAHKSLCACAIILFVLYPKQRCHFPPSFSPSS